MREISHVKADLQGAPCRRKGCAVRAAITYLGVHESIYVHHANSDSRILVAAVRQEKDLLIEDRLHRAGEMFPSFARELKPRTLCLAGR